MIPQNDLDRTLVAWFSTEAEPPPPPEPLARIIATTRVLRSRPSFVAGIGSAWVGDDQSLGASAKAVVRPFILIVLVGLLAVVLVAAAVLVGARLLSDRPPADPNVERLTVDHDGDIFVADRDGMNSVRIVDGVPWSQPEGWRYGAAGPEFWSPDGRYLMYLGFDRRDWVDSTVFISDATGNVVASFPGYESSWSPDGSHVATWDVDSAAVEIYRLDGTHEASLALPPGYQMSGNNAPVWSPDGSTIVVKVESGESQGRWELRLDGMAPRELP